VLLTDDVLESVAVNDTVAAADTDRVRVGVLLTDASVENEWDAERDSDGEHVRDAANDTLEDVDDAGESDKLAEGDNDTVGVDDPEADKDTGEDWDTDVDGDSVALSEGDTDAENVSDPEAERDTDGVNVDESDTVEEDDRDVVVLHVGVADLEPLGVPERVKVAVPDAETLAEGVEDCESVADTLIDLVTVGDMDRDGVVDAELLRDPDPVAVGDPEGVVDGVDDDDSDSVAEKDTEGLIDVDAEGGKNTAATPHPVNDTSSRPTTVTDDAVFLPINRTKTSPATVGSVVFCSTQPSTLSRWTLPNSSRKLDPSVVPNLCSCSKTSAYKPYPAMNEYV
jgi:hypothetical protein